MRVGGPDLLAIDDVAAIPSLGPGLDTGQVTARVGLREALAEEVLGREDARQVGPLLRFARVGNERRTGHVEPYGIRELGGPRAGHLLVEDRLLHDRGPAAAVSCGPLEPDIARPVELPLPVDQESGPSLARILPQSPGELASSQARSLERNSSCSAESRKSMGGSLAWDNRHVKRKTSRVKPEPPALAEPAAPSVRLIEARFGPI